MKRRVIFASKRWTSGETLNVNIYEPDGVKAVDSSSMTELDTKGIYYYDYTTNKLGNHLVYISSDNFSSMQVITVGKSLSQRIYYVAKRWKTGLTDVKIDIYDKNGTKIVDNIVMVEISTIGIYYYDLTLTDEGTYVAIMDTETYNRKEKFTIYYVPSEYFSLKSVDIITTKDEYNITITEENNNYNIDLDEKDITIKEDNYNIPVEINEVDINVESN